MIYKLTLFIVLLFGINSHAFSQEINSSISIDSNYWNNKNTFSLFFNQSAYGNYWKGGGSNSVTTGMELLIKKDYLKSNEFWKNKLQLKYGVIKLGQNQFQKNNDLIEIDSKYGYQLSKLFQLSALFNFNTRVHDTYQISKTGERGKLIGNFMAPGYFNIGSGLDFVTVKKSLAIYYTPVNSKVTVVSDKSLARQFLPKDFERQVRYEFGSLVRIELEKEILSNVFIETTGTFFTNYKSNFGKIDVDLQNKLKFKINKNLSANLVAHIIYDEDVLFDIEDDNGNVSQGPRTQFSEVFNIGFSTNF